VTWQLGALVAAVVATVAPSRRVPAWVAVAAVAIAAIAVRIVPLDAVGDALDALDAPLAFLLLAVPLAVNLDDIGFFASVAALIGSGRHLHLGLWWLAAAVTVVFNLDASVVLLTPLYVHLARRHGDDPVALAFMPALLASLASSALPVSNLTNLIVADHLDLGTGDFLVHAAPATVVASTVGWLCYRRTLRRDRVAQPLGDRPDRRALLIGAPVVAWLLLGFTVGERFGLAAWMVAAVALAATALATRRVPWRAVPLGPAVLALALGTLALAAAGSLHLERVLAIDGPAGGAATFLIAAVGANLVNNLPMVLVFLEPLEAHPDRVWAVLLGVNLGPTLWVTGALSTLLWQSTMGNLGHPVRARQYARIGWRVGLPAIAAVLVASLVLP
jgi:arsenical pump membrane protein